MNIVEEQERARELAHIAKMVSRLTAWQKIELAMLIEVLMQKKNGGTPSLDGALLRLDGGKRVD